MSARYSSGSDAPETSRGGPVTVAIEHHFVRVKGDVFSALAFGYDYWGEYLEYFESVTVVARVGMAEEIPANYFRADGPGVNFVDLPDYLGPRQFLWNAIAILRVVWKASGQKSAFLLRSGNVCNVLWMCLTLRGKRYAREVQGEIQEAITEYTRTKYPVWGAAIAWLSEVIARAQIRRASVASYVSLACRKRYPTTRRDREYVFSGVRIDNEWIREPRQASEFSSNGIRLVSVGRLEREKGHHVLVQGIAILKSRGYPVEATVIGPGSEKESLCELACRLGVSDDIRFVGFVPRGKAMASVLDKSDLFVIPSLTEGMPRALIEAMARGLPSIGSRAGGIVEILEPSQLVSPGDPEQLADAIAHRIGKVALLCEESKRNHSVAVGTYSVSKVIKIKLDFWKHVWVSTGSGSKDTASDNLSRAA